MRDQSLMEGVTMRMAMVTTAAVLALGFAGGALAQDATATKAASPAGDRSVAPKVAMARLELGQKQFDQVVDALTPAVQPAVFDTLSAPMRYRVLALYARALFGEEDFDDAHEAFVDLTVSSLATKQDWALRMVSAQKIGDADDVALAHERLQEAADDSDDDDVAPVA